ncbi:MAG: hypothetical protein E7588_01400 [Ruminococcaceae bacterium]|nr:hypothetical protein [Oscillospiraceae bacterium]
MKRRQAIFLLLISCSLVLTLFLGSIVYYFTANSDVTGALAENDDENTITVGNTVNDLNYISVKRAGCEKDKEIRGVWISTVYNIDFPSKPSLNKIQQMAELNAIVETAKKSNLNTIFFQVRPTSDALYKSEIYPTSAFLTGEQGATLMDDFDPLEYLTKIAHQNGIKLHAWINPFRITPGSKATFESDVNALSEDNPAVVHKEWTVPYEDGKLYFDPGIPEVRQLIIDGAVEIVNNYDVDGIHVDDYFYPYPVYITNENGKRVPAEFKDDYSYGKYGNGADRGDWRRENINAFVRDLKNAVKQADSECEFGVSCAGIWANSSSLKAGSDTNGMQSYFDTYADSKYWIENGLVDYICPQIYWEMSHKTAPFDVVCKWWSSVVDGTDVDLYIGHALYKNPDWSDKTEIARQIEFARSWHGYKGSVFFGFDQLSDNIDGMCDRIASVFYEDYFYPDVDATDESVTFGSPHSSDFVRVGKSYILGKADPGYPLYYNGKKLAKTKNGYFNIYADIKSGSNSFKFTQNGIDTVITLKTADSSVTPKDTNLGGMIIKKAVPTADIITSPGKSISISCTAPAGSAVVATLGEFSVTLKPQGNVKTWPAYEAQTYVGEFKLPVDVPQDKMTDLGNIVFTAKRSDESADAVGSRVVLKPDGYNAFVQVVDDYSYLKISPDSSFYDDYLPASVGMRDYVESLANGYYKLRFGGYIAEKNANFVEGNLSDGMIISAEGYCDNKSTSIKFEVTENVPVNGFCKNGIFTLEIYNVDTEHNPIIEMFENPLFEEVEINADKDNCVTYAFRLKNADNYYGFNVEYVDGYIVLTFRNPVKLNLESDNPLRGITVIVDAGHGGTDTGALGFVSEGDRAMNEKDLNLSVAKALQKYLVAYGASVIMTRSDDTTVSLDERMDFLNKNQSDLVISVHHNSLEYTSNVTRVRGLLGLWWNESGRLLTKSISASAAQGLNRYERTPSAQKLAMCRNHKFPSTLIELGFITSAEEYEQITQPENVDLAGKSLADGVLNYFAAQQKYI